MRKIARLKWTIRRLGDTIDLLAQFLDKEDRAAEFSIRSERGFPLIQTTNNTLVIVDILHHRRAGYHMREALPAVTD